MGAVKSNTIKMLNHHHNLLKSYHVPATMLSALHIKPHLMFKKIATM